jgi:hypothetical protein
MTDKAPNKPVKIFAVHTRLYALDSDHRLWLFVYGRWERLKAPENDVGEELAIAAFTASYVRDDVWSGFTEYALLFDGRLFESHETSGTWCEIT